MMKKIPLGQNIFVEVNDEDEKKSIFRSVVHFKTDLIAKLPAPSSDIFILRCLDIKKDEVEARIEDVSTNVPLLGEMVLKFQSGNDKYLCISDFRLQQNHLFLKWKTRLFRLQRREHYRLRLPASYKGKFKFSSVNSRAYIAECTMVDLSGGGCRVEVPLRDRSWKIGEHIEGQIVLLDRNPIMVNGQIRHVLKVKDFRGKAAIGIKFLGLSDQSQNRLIAIVMDLFREIFSRR